MTFLDTWQFNIGMYFVFVVVFYQCYKVALRHVERDGAATLLLQLIAGTSILALVPFFALAVPSRPEVILLLVLACGFYALTDRLQTTVKKRMEVSRFSIINQLSTVFLVLYGFILFQQPLAGHRLGGMVLIIGANVWLLYDPHRRVLRFDRYSLLAVVSTLLFATALSIDIGISNQFNLPLYVSLTLLVPGLLLLAGERIRPRQVRDEFRRGGRLFMTAGIAWGLSIFFSMRAFQLGEVNVIAPLIALGVILNVLAAFIFLKERSNPLKKLAAAGLVIAGVYLTVI